MKFVDTDADIKKKIQFEINFVPEISKKKKFTKKIYMSDTHFQNN